MSQAYLLPIDFLRTGGTQKFTLELPPEFLEIQEEELLFKETVYVDGEAYLVEENLIVRFDARATALMPCSVCNRMITLSLMLKKVYHTVALEGVKSALYDLRPALREELLIELPRTVECAGGCPERATLMPYLKSTQQEQYFPFSDL